LGSATPLNALANSVANALSHAGRPRADARAAALAAAAGKLARDGRLLGTFGPAAASSSDGTRPNRAASAPAARPHLSVEGQTRGDASESRPTSASDHNAGGSGFFAVRERLHAGAKHRSTKSRSGDAGSTHRKNRGRTRSKSK
jgi:hypothetical protein